MTHQVASTTGRYRRSRQKTLGIVPERVNGEETGRFRLTGHYVAGRRVRHVYASEEQAKEALATLKLQTSKLGERAAHVRGDVLEDALRAVDVLQPHSLNLLEGARMLSDALNVLAPYGKSMRDVVAAFTKAEDARRRSITLGALSKEYVADRERARLSDFYTDDLRKRLRRLEEHLGADRVVSDITAAELAEWLPTLGVSARSEGNFIRNISGAFTFAVKRGFIDSNPFDGVTRPKASTPPPEVFTVAQMAGLLEHAPAELIPVFALGAFAGIRPEELRRLTWSDIDFEAGLVQVAASNAKTARRRLVDMSANLKQWLTPFKDRSGGVVPANERKLRLQAMAGAKITRWPVDVLRHSFASNHLAHHDDAAKTALQLGHSGTQILFAHYRNLVRRDAAAKWWDILPTQPGNVVVFKKPEAA